MAINTTTETILSLADAAASLPARRAGKKPHVTCLYRWTKGGCRGVVLESVQIGGTRCTSKEALARFFERLTYGEPDTGVVAAARSPSARRKASEAAAKELKRMGV